MNAETVREIAFLERMIVWHKEGKDPDKEAILKTLEKILKELESNGA